MKPGPTTSWLIWDLFLLTWSDQNILTWALYLQLLRKELLNISNLTNHLRTNPVCHRVHNYHNRRNPFQPHHLPHLCPGQHPVTNQTRKTLQKQAPVSEQLLHHLHRRRLAVLQAVHRIGEDLCFLQRQDNHNRHHNNNHNRHHNNNHNHNLHHINQSLQVGPVRHWAHHHPDHHDNYHAHRHYNTHVHHNIPHHEAEAEHHHAMNRQRRVFRGSYPTRDKMPMMFTLHS